jgi:hypothetical protein
MGKGGAAKVRKPLLVLAQDKMAEAVELRQQADRMDAVAETLRGLAASSERAPRACDQEVCLHELAGHKLVEGFPTADQPFSQSEPLVCEQCEGCCGLTVAALVRLSA